jgi:hypothetical protein
MVELLSHGSFLERMILLLSPLIPFLFVRSYFFFLYHHHRIHYCPVKPSTVEHFPWSAVKGIKTV